jgi:hypothetical protein
MAASGAPPWPCYLAGVKSPSVALAFGLATLLAGATAGAQAADGGASASEPYAGGVLRLTPPAPDGGIYGEGTPPATAPSPTPATTAPTEPTTASTTLPPPPAADLDAPPPPPDTPHPPRTQTSPNDSSLDTPEPRRRPSSLRTRLHLLNSTLPPLAERSRNQRILDSVLSLAVGAGMGALGFIVPTSPGNDLRPWFWTIGGVSLTTGVVNLAWVPARESLTARFVAMPMRTAAERRARLEFGERAIEEIAADGARRRVLGAIGNAATSVGMLALIYRDPLFNGTPYTLGVYDAIVLGFTGLSVVTGLLQLFTRSDDERLRDEYWRQTGVLRTRQSVE